MVITWPVTLTVRRRGTRMMTYNDLALGQKLDVLRLKMADLEQQIASLRKDVKRVLSLIERDLSVRPEPEPGNGETEDVSKV